MKLAKMSMVAALLLGANAYAIDNVKVNGDAKLYYSTDDSEKTVNGNTSGGLFEQDSSAAQAALRLGVTADLTEGVSAGVTMTALSTLGLESNLVGNLWEDQTATWKSDYWFSEAWLAGTAGKTTGKIGRQTLDTPLLYTETWSIAPNTFESIVAINQDIPDTTLVAAYVGNHSSSNGALGSGSSSGFGGVVSSPDVAEGDSRFIQTAGVGNGAYAFGVVNNSFKPLTVQAWYYDVVSTATAMWAQADLDMEGILVGAQYATFEPAASGAQDGDATAVMIGYAMKDVVTVKAAYSTTDSNVGAGQNVAGEQSKLYTEMWWSRGQITQADTDTWKVSAEGTAAGLDLMAQFASADHGTNAATANKTVDELAVSVSKSFGPLDASLVYLMLDKDAGEGVISAYQGATPNTAAAENMLQVYLTYNF